MGKIKNHIFANLEIEKLKHRQRYHILYFEKSDVFVWFWMLLEHCFIPVLEIPISAIILNNQATGNIRTQYLFREDSSRMYIFNYF